MNVTASAGTPRATIRGKELRGHGNKVALSIHFIKVRWTAHNETAVTITLYAKDTFSLFYLMPPHQGGASGASTNETEISKETFSVQLHHKNEKRVPLLTCEKKRSNCRIFSHVIQ